MQMSSVSSIGKAKCDKDAIDMYENEQVSCAIPEHTAKPTVSLQLPEKVWYIEGKLVVTNMRLIFIPQSIRGNLFPQILLKDKAAYLSIYLAGIDHLVLVQQNNRKIKLRRFNTSADADLLQGRVEKLEVHCLDFASYKFCFNSLHKQRRSLLEKISNSGSSATSNGGSGSSAGVQLSAFSQALRASILDGLNRTTGWIPQARGSNPTPGAYRVEMQDQAQMPGPQMLQDNGAADVSKLINQLRLFAFSNRPDLSASATASLFSFACCKWFNYEDILTREWCCLFGKNAIATVSMDGSGSSACSAKVILPLPANVAPSSVTPLAVEYYQGNGHPRLVFVYSETPQVAVIRSGKPRGHNSVAAGASAFFTQSMEFETSLLSLYSNLERFDCDATLPRLKTVRQSRKRLLHHCVVTHCPDAMSLDKILSDSDSGFLSGLEATGWLKLVLQCLDNASRLAHSVVESKCTVWLLESADRDWNCLMSSLLRLMICPAARTLRGFERLLQTEWISRHPFRLRMVDLSHAADLEAEQDASDRASASGSVANGATTTSSSGSGACGNGVSLFLLFLDCVWQLVCRYPGSFEMSSVYLTLLHDVSQWPVFQENAFLRPEDAIFESRLDRADHGKRPGSLFDWSAYVRQDVIDKFVNSRYTPTESQRVRLHGPAGTVWRMCELRFWCENYGRNVRFLTAEVLIPSVVYAGNHYQEFKRFLNSFNARSPIMHPATRQACFYGDRVSQRQRRWSDGDSSPHYGAPFNWPAEKIVEQLLRHHIKEVGADFTQQLDAKALVGT